MEGRLSREERIRRLAERRSGGRRRSPAAVRWVSIVVGTAATVGLTTAMARADASSPTTTTVPATSPSTLVVVVHRPVSGVDQSGQGSVAAVPAPSQTSPFQMPRVTTHGSR